MSKYRIINCVTEGVVEKSRLPVKKRIIRRNARESPIYCEEDDSSAIILSEPLLRRDNEPVNNIFSNEAISEYELSIDPQLDPDEYFQCDQYPLAKSREEIQFWVTTSQPPCLYYSDNDVPKYKTRRRLVKKPPTKKYLKRGPSYGVDEIFSNSSDSESVENNYEVMNNKIKKNHLISSETGDVKYQVVRSIKLKMPEEESQSKLMKSERNKGLFKRTQPDMCTDDKNTSLKIQLSKKQLNNLSMNVERGSFSFHDGKILPAQKKNNPTLTNTPEKEEAPHRKIIHNTDELLEDFDSCSSVLTVNYIRSVNSAAKRNGKTTSTRKKQYFSYNNKSPQKRHSATDTDCKILRHNQYENYVPNVQLGLNRIKCDKANPFFLKSIKKEKSKPKPAVNNEREYLNESNAKSLRISVYRPSLDEMKRNNEKVLDSCPLSTSSIENDISEHRRNQSVKSTVSQVMAVKTYTSHHNTISYSDENISSENSDVPLNVVNKSIKHTTRTISFTQVEKIQYFVNH